MGTITKKEIKERILGLEKLISRIDFGIEVETSKRKHLLYKLSEVDKTINELGNEVNEAIKELEELKQK